MRSFILEAPLLGGCLEARPAAYQVSRYSGNPQTSQNFYIVPVRQLGSGLLCESSDATSSLLHDSIRTHRKLLHYKFEYLEDHLEQLLYVHAIWRVQL